MKNKVQKSNAHSSWTCLQRKINEIMDPSIPQNHLLLDISMWGTLFCFVRFHLIAEPAIAKSLLFASKRYVCQIVWVCTQNFWVQTAKLDRGHNLLVHRSALPRYLICGFFGYKRLTFIPIESVQLQSWILQGSHILKFLGFSAQIYFNHEILGK